MIEGEKGRREGRRIVTEHSGKTGEALAVAILAKTDPALAGRYVGYMIVADNDGRTGVALADAILIQRRRRH